MKRIVIILIAASFIFASCQKNELEEMAPQTEPETTMEDLNVSPDFDWKTSNALEITLEANKSGVVYINSEDGDTYQKAFLKGNKTYETSITIPTYAKEVNFKFNGKMYSTEVTGDKISLDLV
ncbi:MAG: hypothetical protein K9I94_12350 [Bacteroidales bacterium]|nr:hypothetical protein [Bacteroidales bacterium]